MPPRTRASTTPPTRSRGIVAVGPHRLRRQHRLRPARPDAHPRRPARRAAAQPDPVAQLRPRRRSARADRPADHGAQGDRPRARPFGRAADGRRTACSSCSKPARCRSFPAQGSVGASGDLAPLAHMSAALIGEGSIALGGEILPASEALARLGPRTARARPQGRPGADQRHPGLDRDRARRPVPRRARVRLGPGQRRALARRVQGHRRRASIRASTRCAASRARSTSPPRSSDLLAGSAIRASHADCDRVQDPYSFRCQPQVMGAALDLIRNAARDARDRGQCGHRQSDHLRRRRGVGRQFPRRAGRVRGRHAGDGLVRGRLDLRAPRRGAGRSQDERPARLPGPGQRGQFGLHDRAGHRRRSGLRE